MKTNIYARLLSTFTCLFLTSTTPVVAKEKANRSAPQDELQSWIGKNAVGMRSIDAADENFKDLEFLIDVIGDAQIVQLGEASHSVGNGFAAKARLAKFLYQRMGFDVLVWEEGIYDMRLIQAGLRGSEDVLAVAQLGIRKGWSDSEEVRPLFEYAKASLLNPRPLEMAGYDSRFSAKSFEHFASSLRSFATALRDAAARKHSQDLNENAIAAYNRICCTKDVQPGQQQDLDNVHHTADALLEDIRTNRTVFEQVHGERETSFMERAVESMRSDGTGKFYLAQMTPDSPDSGMHFSKFWHQRDEQGARNFRWLIEKQYPGRKIMYWAHNVHVMDAYCGRMFKGIHLDPQPDDMKPVGVYLADWYGDKIYTIGMAHYQGNEGLTGSPDSKPLPLAPPDNLEARLHVLGQPYLFLNLRTLDTNVAHPLRKPQSMRVIFPTNEKIADITKVFDGIFYIDTATPATPVKKQN